MDWPGLRRCRHPGLALLVALLLTACSTAWLRWEDRETHYTVQPGDTLYQIAFRHQLDYRDLAWWNGIGRDYTIRPGQVLRLVPPLPGELRTPPQRETAAAPPARRPAATPPPQTAGAQAPQRPASPPAAAGPRRWQWPVEGRVLASFAPAKGQKGLDIAGREGDPVHAAAAGKVVYAGGALKGYGQLVIIKHDEEYLTAYGHNARLLVREGAKVEAGEQVATMGLGPENRPLLHFEIRRFGKPLDPLPLLPPRG